MRRHPSLSPHDAAQLLPTQDHPTAMLSEPQVAGPSTALMRKAYARWAPVYDVVYDKLTEPAARAAVG